MYELVRSFPEFVGHTASIETVFFMPDGKTVASGSYDKTVKFWDVSSGELVSTLGGQNCQLGSIAFSPDCKMLASNEGSDTIKLLKWQRVK